MKLYITVPKNVGESLGQLFKFRAVPTGTKTTKHNRNRNLCEILFPKSAAFVVTYPDACLGGAEPRWAVSDMDIRHGRTSYRRIVIGRINTQL